MSRPRAALIAFLARDEPPREGTFFPEDHRYVAGLTDFGRPWLVRAAREAAALALPVWQARFADVREPGLVPAALDRWLACPCEACAAAASGLAHPLGWPEDRAWGPLTVSPGRDASEAEAGALDCLSCAALTPITDEIETYLRSAIVLAGRALSPAAPMAARVRARIWARLAERARDEPFPQPGERAGPSPTERMQAIDDVAERIAFAGVVASRAITERHRQARVFDARVLGPRRAPLFERVHGGAPRFTAQRARPVGWPDDGRWVGPTLAIEARESIAIAPHPLAGVLLVTVVHDVRSGEVSSRTRSAFLRLADRAIHAYERPLTHAAVEPQLLSHVLDALSLWERVGGG